ncbi:hypothetical protein HMPREF1146_1461 [Prevotella sp. MSX73]|nr:hypothetical protein HMPREF1146_1461 [Prevotella sp. MSX73]
MYFLQLSIFILTNDHLPIFHNKLNDSDYIKAYHANKK